MTTPPQSTSMSLRTLALMLLAVMFSTNGYSKDGNRGLSPMILLSETDMRSIVSDLLDFACEKLNAT